VVFGGGAAKYVTLQRQRVLVPAPFCSGSVGRLIGADAETHRFQARRALKSGQLAGYAGDVWFPQPPPKDHLWRTMPHHGMTPHTSGTSLSAQARYAAGTREILECWFEDRPIRDEYLIVDSGKLAGTGAYSYSVGNT
jgi:hypothetical protein